MGLVDGPTTENSLKNRNPEAYERYKRFAQRLLAENQAFIADYHANKEGRTDANGKYYPKHCMMRICQVSTMALYPILILRS